MTTCKYNTIDISLFLCKKMSPEETQEFCSHLQQCPHCREKMKVIKRISQNILKEHEKSYSSPIKIWKITRMLCIIGIIFVLFIYFKSSKPISYSTPPTYLYADTTYVLRKDSVSSSYYKYEYVPQIYH